MTMFTRCAGLMLAIAALGAPLAAQAQQTRTIEVPANKKWQHAATGIIVPTNLLGMPRTGITDSTADESDIFLQFGDPDTTSLTLYLFRPGIADPSIWFDRIEPQILGREVYGKPVPTGAVITFAPPGGTTTSALRRVYLPGKGPYTATGAAMVPLADWLVAARLSSTTLDPAALDAKLLEALAGLGWPKPGTAAEPTATPIQPCATPLAFAKKAKLKKPDMTMSLMGAMLAGMAEDPEVEKTPVEGPKGHCREGLAGLESATYRALNGGEGYTIAMGDAGRTISVYRAFSFEEKDPGFTVTLNDLSATYVYPSFDKLPAPEKVIEMVRKTRPISSSKRGSKDLTIHVD